MAIVSHRLEAHGAETLVVPEAAFLIRISLPQEHHDSVAAVGIHPSLEPEIISRFQGVFQLECRVGRDLSSQIFEVLLCTPFDAGRHFQAYNPVR